MCVCTGSFQVNHVKGRERLQDFEEQKKKKKGEEEEEEEVSA